jgi:hypothetical protein
MESNNMMCFIRRDGQPWSRGRQHHHDALISFMNSPYNLNEPNPVFISVPHTDGGNFVAHFTLNNENSGNNENNENGYQYLSKYVDQYGQTVEIMLCNPAYAAYINRIVDF